MNDTLLSKILEIFAPILTVVVTGISLVLGTVLSRWQAREQLKTMQINSKLAVQAVEQLAVNQPNEVKAQMALALAQTWNTSAKITAPDTSVTPMNEANVLTLPQPVVIPKPETIDDIPKG
jgi:hypothetical protein